MPKKTAAILVAILAALAFFIGVAFATTNTVTGEVVSANPSANILVINAQGKEMTFRVAQNAVRLVRYLFTGFLEDQETTSGDVDKATNALANLTPGEEVTVSYTEADGKLTAQSFTRD